MNEKLSNEIQVEQNHGRQKYGSGPNDFDYDDALPESLWHQFISDHNQRAIYASQMDRRQHLVKVAGLAVSAIEAFDRKRLSLTKGKGL